MADLTPQQILMLPIEKQNKTDATTVGQLLIRVLGAYYEENWDFKTTAPLGQEGWKVPIRNAFRKAGLIPEDEYNTDYHIHQALEYLFEGDFTTLEIYREPKDWYPVFLEVGDDGIPVLVDYFQNGFTEEEARKLVETHNTPFDEPRWVAVRIPKES